MGNVHRSWLIVGVINAVVAFGVLFYWNSSAADDTPVAEKPAAQPTATSFSLSSTDNDAKVIKALAKTVTLDFSDTPLRDALAEIGKQQGIRVWFDDRALADLNITSETPVTRKLSDVSLKSALRLLLRPLQLTFRANSGVLQITSQAEYDNQLEIRVYPVGDIVAPFNKPDARDQA
ncbi:MAG TPA: hypothetical protein VJ809_16365, partial [Pirellulales bacterium]|nr:hypothetical protein [Pirellulales bacterium]